MLKLTTVVIPLSLLASSSLIYASEYDSRRLDLEPCMNGAVSASGMFSTNAAELKFYADAEQEPCMNGDVPPDGVLARDNLDDTVEKVVAVSRP